MTAVPTSVSVFWTSDVTPSVTSWSSASTSFVSRLMMTPAPSRATTSRRPCRRARASDARPAGELSRRRLHARGELLLEQPVLVDVAVDGAAGDELVVRPACDDPAAVEHDDLVRERDRGEA